MIAGNAHRTGRKEICRKYAYMVFFVVSTDRTCYNKGTYDHIASECARMVPIGKGDIFMRKVLYVVDIRPDVYNSVIEILHNLLERVSDQDKVVAVTGYDYEFLRRETLEGTCTVYGETLPLGKLFRDQKTGFREKCFCLSRRLLKYFARGSMKDVWRDWSNKEFFRRVLEKEKPDMVCFMIWRPFVPFAKLCEQNNIPYIQMLYDTFLNRPDFDGEKIGAAERYVVEHSHGYFVPSFFYEGYVKAYGDTPYMEKIHAFDLPLLVARENVLTAMEGTEPQYDYSYFGQIQSFRNADKIEEIFKKLNLKMDVFTATDYQGDEVFRVHKAVVGAQLWETVARSRFLVAFDNAAPFHCFLPSKAYLYVSFTKPIIVFGDNEHSAIQEFLRDYPLYYYQNIHESTDGLVKFLQSAGTSGFDGDLYSHYARYLPEKALQPIIAALS